MGLLRTANSTTNLSSFKILTNPITSPLPIRLKTHTRNMSHPPPDIPALGSEQWDRYDYWGPKPFVRLEKKGDGRSCLTWYMPSIVHDKSTPIRSGSLPPDLITHCVNQLVELMGATWTDNDHVSEMCFEEGAACRCSMNLAKQAALVVERAINTLPLGDLKSAIDDKETDVEKSLDP